MSCIWRVPETRGPQIRIRVPRGFYWGPYVHGHPKIHARRHRFARSSWLAEALNLIVLWLEVWGTLGLKVYEQNPLYECYLLWPSWIPGSEGFPGLRAGRDRASW